MSLDNFQQAIRFANQSSAKILIISGGEPTSHPQFGEFLTYASKMFNGGIVVTTHGMYISEPTGCDWFSVFPEIQFQITNDDRYYPVKIDKEAIKYVEATFKNVVFCDRIGGDIYPQGRAIRYLDITHRNSKCKGTKCFNLRSISNHQSTSGFTEVISILESQGRFCTPSINIDGSIAMGESNQCSTVGTIYQPMSKLYEAITSSQCNDCLMLNKLTPLHWNAIGYRKK